MFLRSFLEWWGGQSPLLRYGVGLLFLGISTALYFFADRVWIWGWIIGAVMIMFGGPSDSEKRGYHF